MLPGQVHAARAAAVGVCVCAQVCLRIRPLLSKGSVWWCPSWGTIWQGRSIM